MSYFHTTWEISQESYPVSPFIVPFFLPYLRGGEVREEGKGDRGGANISKEHRMVSGDTNSFPQMLPKGNVRTKKQASMLCIATLAFFSLSWISSWSEICTTLPTVLLLQTSLPIPSSKSLQNQIIYSNKSKTSKVNNLYVWGKGQANL